MSIEGHFWIVWKTFFVCNELAVWQYQLLILLIFITLTHLSSLFVPLMTLMHELNHGYKFFNPYAAGD